MIGYLRGHVDAVHGGRAVITPKIGDGQGVGYCVILPVGCHLTGIPTAGFFIWHVISQDDQKLYAFDIAEERFLAELVATTQRIGAGTAHRIVTTLGHDGTVAMIKNGDEAGLAKAVKGLGAKGASSIIANLKGKLGDVVAGCDPRIKVVQNALRALGIEVTAAHTELTEKLCKTCPNVDAQDVLKAVLAQRGT